MRAMEEARGVRRKPVIPSKLNDPRLAILFCKREEALAQDERQGQERPVVEGVDEDRGHQ
jgi:hypothetical protein